MNQLPKTTVPQIEEVQLYRIGTEIFQSKLEAEKAILDTRLRQALEDVFRRHGAAAGTGMHLSQMAPLFDKIVGNAEFRKELRGVFVQDLEIEKLNLQATGITPPPAPTPDANADPEAQIDEIVNPAVDMSAVQSEAPVQEAPGSAEATSEEDETKVAEPTVYNPTPASINEASANPVNEATGEASESSAADDPDEIDQVPDENRVVRRTPPKRTSASSRGSRKK